MNNIIFISGASSEIGVALIESIIEKPTQKMNINTGIYILNPNWDSIEHKIVNQAEDPVKEQQQPRNNRVYRPGRSFINSWKDL